MENGFVRRCDHHHYHDQYDQSLPENEDGIIISMPFKTSDRISVARRGRSAGSELLQQAKAAKRLCVYRLEALGN